MMNTQQNSYSSASATTTAASPLFNNPYISATPLPSTKDPTSDRSDQVNKWGKTMEQTTTGIWQHLRTGPNLLDTTLGRLSHGTRVLKEGGYENVFKQTFQTCPDEKVKDSFACFLSTSTGPLAGHLFVSTKKIAFASNRPFSHEQKPGEIVSSYYKVMIPLNKVMVINASRNPKNYAEKYIQVTTSDHHEFWFMGFVNHEKAIKVLREAQAHSLQQIGSPRLQNA